MGCTISGKKQTITQETNPSDYLIEKDSPGLIQGKKEYTVRRKRRDGYCIAMSKKHNKGVTVEHSEMQKEKMKVSSVKHSSFEREQSIKRKHIEMKHECVKTIDKMDAELSRLNSLHHPIRYAFG